MLFWIRLQTKTISVVISDVHKGLCTDLCWPAEGAIFPVFSHRSLFLWVLDELQTHKKKKTDYDVFWCQNKPVYCTFKWEFWPDLTFWSKASQSTFLWPEAALSSCLFAAIHPSILPLRPLHTCAYCSQ